MALAGIVIHATIRPERERLRWPGADGRRSTACDVGSSGSARPGRSRASSGRLQHPGQGGDHRPGDLRAIVEQLLERLPPQAEQQRRLDRGDRRRPGRRREHGQLTDDATRLRRPQRLIADVHPHGPVGDHEEPVLHGTALDERDAGVDADLLEQTGDRHELVARDARNSVDPVQHGDALDRQQLGGRDGRPARWMGGRVDDLGIC